MGVEELLAGGPCREIVEDVKRVLIATLREDTVMSELWISNGPKTAVSREGHEGTDDFTFLTMAQGLLQTCASEACGRTRGSSRPPETLDEFAHSIQHAGQGAGDAVIMLATLAFHTRILTARSSPTHVADVQVCQHGTQRGVGADEHAPLLQLMGKFDKSGVCGHWYALVQRSSTAPAALPGTSSTSSSNTNTTEGRKAKRKAQAALTNTASLGGNSEAPRTHLWTDICSWHPMELSSSVLPAGALRGVRGRAKFHLISCNGGGLCGDVCLMLVRASMSGEPVGGGAGEQRGLVDILCSERARLLEAARCAETDPPCGSDTYSAAWAKSTATLHPIIANCPKTGPLFGWRDLEFHDIVIAASKMKLPVAIFRTAPATTTTKRSRKDYFWMLCHNNLNDEVRTMAAWIGIFKGGDEHYQLLAVKTPKTPRTTADVWQVVLGESHWTTMMSCEMSTAHSAPKEILNLGDAAVADLHVHSIAGHLQESAASPGGANEEEWPRVWRRTLDGGEAVPVPAWKWPELSVTDSGSLENEAMTWLAWWGGDVPEAEHDCDADETVAAADPSGPEGDTREPKKARFEAAAATDSSGPMDPEPADNADVAAAELPHPEGDVPELKKARLGANPRKMVSGLRRSAAPDTQQIRRSAPDTQQICRSAPDTS